MNANGCGMWITIFFPVKSVFADDISILLVDLAVSQDSEHHKKWAR